MGRVEILHLLGIFNSCIFVLWLNTNAPKIGIKRNNKTAMFINLIPYFGLFNNILL